MAVMIDTRRQATWTNIGTNVEMSTTIGDVLETAGLDYSVSMKPIYLDGGIMIPNKAATINDKTNKVYGIVSNNYTICQNEDAFSFIANIDDKLSFVKAGETKSGMIYVIAKLDDVDVLGDSFTPYVIFQNGHNGNYTLRTTICPLRIICQNQFAMSFRESANTINIRHSNQLEVQMKQAEALLRNTATYMKNFTATAEELASMKITNEKELIQHFFEQGHNLTEMTTKQLAKIDDKSNTLYNIYRNAPDNANFQGTMWGLLNGFTDYTTHLLPQRKTETSDETKFTTVTMDPRAIYQFIEFAKSYAGIR